MRGKLSYIIILLFALLALGGWDAYAVSDWTTYEYNTSNAPISDNKIIYLSDNVNLNQAIVIKKGAKVTIRKSSTAPSGSLYIYNRTGTGTSSGSRMFIVESGGILQIIGTENNMIILDGGSSLEWNNYNLTQKSGTTTRRLYEAIQNMGTLKLDYVCIQDVWASRDLNGGAIQICTQGTNLPCGTTEITNSIIRRCRAQHGSAIHIDEQTSCRNNTPTSCKVTIQNTQIQYCYNVGSDDDNTPGDGVLGGGGTIRTRGSAVACLELTNTKISTNRSVSGGGLYWNAGGWADGKTKCTIDGCTFDNNHATDNGGGMMLESSFEFTGSQTTITENNANGQGGGIYICGYGGGLISGGTLDFNLTNKLNITNNTATNGGGISFYFGGMSFTQKTYLNAVINGCNISNNTSKEYGGAICFRNYSSNSLVEISIKLNSGTFNGNTAVNKGGALYVENTDIKVSDNLSSSAVIDITNNSVTKSASGYGGAIYISEGNVELGKVNITGNTSSSDGGGIYISKGSLNLKGNTVIQGNTAVRNGGGLWIDHITGENALYVRGKTQIKNNTAERTGGGVFINAGNFLLSEGGNLEVTENTSKKGGGAYIIGTLFVRSTSKFTNNKVTYDAGVYESGYGGGMFISTGNLIVGDYNSANSKIEISGNHAEKFGGGIHINGGDIEISNCKISNNYAGYNQNNTGAILDANACGGAISASEGTINIKAGEISNNYAAKNGGGVYVNNTDFTTAAKTVELTGAGAFQNNHAVHGGGMYVGGNIKMTFSGSFINNKATNGGGLFLTNGAQLTITGGFLRQNRAIGTTGQTSPGTGYQIAASNLHGIGGGVYLNNGYSASYPTKLDFALTGNSIGIYDNYATWGADDVFASGKNTSVTLPNINQMTITDFETPANTPLYWAEDYITNDPNYGYGTKEKSTWDSDKTNDRYDFALTNSRNIYHIDFGNAQTMVLTKYLSHQVGYELIYVTLVKKGLNPGENAVFTFTPATKKISDTVYEVETGTKPYQNVIFVCKDSDQTINGVVRKLAIPSGWWKIDETSWSWTYNADNGTQYDTPVKIDADHKEFEFKNVRKANTPKTDEDIVENQMKSSINVITASE